jgi:hypothetical protein
MGLGSGIWKKPIPNPGVKKAPDPGSGSTTLAFIIFYRKTEELKKADLICLGQCVGDVTRKFTVEQVIFDYLIVVSNAGLSTSSVHSTLQQNIRWIRNLQQ